MNTITQSTDVDLDGVLRLLWRRRTLILIPVLASLLGTGLALVLVKPRYQSTVLLKIEDRSVRILGVPELVPDMPTGGDLASTVVRTEVEVLRSRALADEVVRSEHLIEDPEFNPGLAPQPFWKTAAEALFGAPAKAPDAIHHATVDAFSKMLSVQPLNRSLVISVGVGSTDPAKAERLATAVAHLYLERQRRQKRQSAASATGWLGERLKELRAAVSTAEDAAAAYRSEHRLGQQGESSAAAAQRAELIEEVIKARAARAEAEARLEQLLAVETSGSLRSASAVLASPLIQRLQEQAAAVERRLADLSARYGMRHPRIKEAEAEREGIAASILIEARKLLESAREEAAVARAREAALNAALAELEKKRSDEGAAAVRLAELEREAATSRAVYESFLARYKEATSQVGLASPDVEILSEASIPVRPAWPRPGMAFTGAFMGGSLVGLAAVFLAERLDRRLRRADDVRRYLGRDLLGQVPLAQVHGPVPDGRTEEEIRSIRVGLALAEHPRQPSVVCITSSMPGEGKSTLAAWLGATAAASGKVVLVDCDLRRSRLAHLFGQCETPGLPEVLNGSAGLAAALRPTGIHGLSVIPARPLNARAGDLLGSPAMADLLARLRQDFDLVVMDAPPVFGTADARLVAPFADAVLFSVQWEKTPHDLVAEGLSLIGSCIRAQPHVVLTQVDLRKQASYGYGGYNRDYRKYMAQAERL